MRPLALAALFASACQQAAAIEPAKDETPDHRFERDMLVRFHMHESFDMLRLIEKRLIRGKLEEAREIAQGLAEAPGEPALGPWSLHEIAVRDRAAVVARAKTIEEACRAEARIAVACAGCHVEANATPDFRPPGPMPPDDSTVETRMARHLWATDRLWEGIVGGDDESWLAGLDVLADTPLQDPTFSPARVRLARELQQLAAAAKHDHRSTTADDRARTYGNLLITCSACHAQSPAP